MNLESLKTGHCHPGDCGVEAKTLPDWMDVERFKRGQQYFQRHAAAVLLAQHYALTIGFAVINLIQPLTYTRNSDTPPKALLRYLKTFIHVILWQTEDVWDENTRAHKSIHTVRRMHDTVRKAMESQNPNKKYISQYDMTLVQSGFMAVGAMYPSSFGIKCTKEELGDHVFCWRGIGYLLGIKDEYNLCSGNYNEFHRVGKEIEYEIIYRGLLEPPTEFETLADAYVNGINSYFKVKLFTKESIISFTTGSMRLPMPNLKLTWTDSLRCIFYKLVFFSIRWVPGFERLLNCLVMSLFKKILAKEAVELAREKDTVLNLVNTWS